MTIRDDLAAILNPWVTTWTTDEADGPDARPQPSMRARTADELADAVLDWLGQLDPDADPELIAWHLRENANEIEKLRRQLETCRRRLAGEQERVNNQASSIEQYQQENEENATEIERLRERMTNLSNDRNRQINDAARKQMRLRDLIRVLADALDHRTAWSGSACMCTDDVCAVETADDALAGYLKRGDSE